VATASVQSANTALRFSPTNLAREGLSGELMVDNSLQVLYLFILAMPIASVAWTVTHEEVVREFRDFCIAESKTCRRIYERKFFYLFTCEYCFSHYVTAAFLIITRFKLLYPDWRGYLIAEFALVWMANLYMGIFGRIRLDIRKERAEITAEEAALQKI
jgi:hypothetical protein